jgi:hypothetical protein
MKFELIDNWRNAWRLGSVKLAFVAATIATVLTASPVIAIGLISFIPNGGARVFVAAFVGLIVFVIPTITRIIKKKTEPECDEQPEQ